jgi:hypothetical protein
VPAVGATLVTMPEDRLVLVEDVVVVYWMTLPAWPVWQVVLRPPVLLVAHEVTL